MVYRDMNNLPGPGDEETWGPCVGHPLDPRTVNLEETQEYQDSQERIYHERLDDTYGWFVESISEAEESVLKDLAARVKAAAKSGSHADYSMVGQLVVQMTKNSCEPSYDEVLEDVNSN